MSERIKVPVSDKHARVFWQIYGLGLAVEALGGDKPVSALPGFALAKALVEKELAEMRAGHAASAYRAVAAAGHDVSNIRSILSTVDGDRLVLEIEPADLVDVAES